MFGGRIATMRNCSLTTIVSAVVNVVGSQKFADCFTASRVE
jgi:hypothetical protein